MPLNHPMGTATDVASPVSAQPQHGKVYSVGMFPCPTTAVKSSQKIRFTSDISKPVAVQWLPLRFTHRGRSGDVCDTDTTRATACAKSLESIDGQSPQVIGDFRQILDDNAVDALICAAPNHWHAPATILACAAGKHVYVEKPCCHNPHEGELMVAVARKHNRAVQMGSQRRSSQSTIQAMDKLREGVIGRVYLARAWYNNLRPSLGHGQLAEVPPNLDYDLWQGPAPRVPYVDNRIHYNWHWFWQWGNGELGNNGIHTLDLCRWGLGVEYPIGVASSGGRYRYDDDQETPDTQTVDFEFDGRRQITWQGLSCNKHTGGFVTFYGESAGDEVVEARV